MNNKGSTLVILVIVMTIIITLGVSILNISMMHYNIKKFNTESKQSFYKSETGLNTAYVDACELINEAIVDSTEKTEEYLNEFTLNEIEIENIFRVKYRLYIVENIADAIYKKSNPIVEITNVSTLFFVEDKLTVNVKSKYNSINKDEITYVDIVILIPKYVDVKDNAFEATDYISFDNWS